MNNNYIDVNKNSFMNFLLKINNQEQENLLICLFILIIGIIFGKVIGIIFALALIFLSFWQPELSLVLIFFSGFLKSIDIVRSLPIDLTVFATLLLLINSYLRIIKKGKLTKLRGFDFLIIFQGLLVLFSVTFVSSGTQLNWWDAGRFLAFNIPLYLGLFLISAREKEIVNIIYWILYGVLAIFSSAIHNLIFREVSIWNITAFGEESYITIGLFLGLGILYYLHDILFSKQILSRKIFHLALAVSLIFLIPFIPSRSILVSLILASLFIFSRLHWKRYLKLISVVALLLVSIYIGIYAANIYRIDFKRLWSYRGVYAGGVIDRINFLKDSIEIFKEKPILGIGMGEFMFLHGGRGNYPHNLLMEALVSFGILSIFIFWPTFFVSLINSIIIFRNKKMKNAEIISIWFIFYFFESLFSGSLSDFRILWLFMGILSILSNPVLKEQTNSINSPAESIS